MEKFYAFRALKANPGMMTSTTPTINAFYASTYTTALQTMDSIEVSLANNDSAAVVSLMSGFTPTNAIETNYKTFYSILKNTQDSIISTSDSASLFTLANGCPFTDGAVVYQARALYNIIYDGYYWFYNVCGSGLGARSSREDSPIDDKEINVILKTTLYPNPNDGNYTLKIQDIKQKDNVEITIFDITGKVVFEEKKTLNENNEIKLKSDLQNGMYLIKVKLEDGTTDVHRLIISK
jgi:hypothetical protein